MAKPPPYPPKAMGPRKPIRPKPKATPMGKIMGKAKSMKVDPMDYMGSKPKQGRNPPPNAPKPRTLTGVEAARAAAKEMALGQQLPSRPRKKKKGMGY